MSVEPALKTVTQPSVDTPYAHLPRPLDGSSDHQNVKIQVQVYYGSGTSWRTRRCICAEQTLRVNSYQIAALFCMK